MGLKEPKRQEPQIIQSANSNSSRTYCSAMAEKPTAETVTSFSICSTKTLFSYCLYTTLGSILGLQEPTFMIHGCIRPLMLLWLGCLFAGLGFLIGSLLKRNFWLILIITKSDRKTNVSVSSYIGDGISTPSGKASQSWFSRSKLLRVQLANIMIMQYQGHLL